MLKSVAFAIAAVVASWTTAHTVLLSGRARDCFEGKPQSVSAVIVTAFDLKYARRLSGQLRRMDKSTFADGDSLAMSRFDVQYSTLVGLLLRTRNLGRAKSAADGRFSFRVPPSDSVLVVGYEEMEDEPYYYAYAIVPGRANRSFILDMSRGRCAK
jgi:hypothetical protein